ncbi:MAG: CopD family protein [Nitrososphaeraceae archaeon]
MLPIKSLTLHISFKFILIIVLAIGIAHFIQNVEAHPVVINSIPKQFQSVETAPKDVTVFFSEPIVLKFSEIIVLDSEGNPVQEGDASNLDGDPSTITIPLKKEIQTGTYTIVTKVLSAVDGHVVDNSVIFNIGDAGSATDLQKVAAEDKDILKLLSLENSFSRIPGYIGQIILIGSIFTFLWIRKPFLRFNWLIDSVETYAIDIRKNLLRLGIFSTLLILASIIVMVIVQASSINGTVSDVFSTEFGNMVLIRLVLSIALLSILISLYRKAKSSPLRTRNAIIILATGLAILLTNSLISHAAALENNLIPIFLDYFHGFAASIWIGGLIFLSFVLVPKLLKVTPEILKIKLASIIIPRFSSIILPILGSLSLTGPTLLWSIENDFSLAFSSLYGNILVIKLTLAVIMIILGAYHQFITQKKIQNPLLKEIGDTQIGNYTEVGNTQLVSTSLSVLNKFKNSIRIESFIGIALLLIVSLMTNMVLPSGEFPDRDNENNIFTGSGLIGMDYDRRNDENQNVYSTTLFSNDQKIEVELEPLRLGQNNIVVTFTDSNGSQIRSIDNASLKISQTEKGIGPILIEMNKDSESKFSASVPISTLGLWLFELQGKTSEPNIPNTVSSFSIDIRPRISDFNFNITEYKFPEQSLPLYPVYHSQSNSIWIGDTSPGSGRLWEFSLENKNYTMHKIDSINLITLSVFDLQNPNVLWLVDPTLNILGKYNIGTEEFNQYQIPVEGIVSGLTVDDKENVWITNMQDNSIIKFGSVNNEFESFNIPTANSNPLGLAFDKKSNNVWFIESIGKIGKIDLETKVITEYPGENDTVNDNIMVEPTFLLLDPDTSNIFISDHGNNKIFQFNQFTETFKEFALADPEGLAFGMTFDQYNNIWIAEHVVDTLALLDPIDGETFNVNIPTKGSFIQYIISDSNGEVWFAEQRGNALGKVSMTFNPSIVQTNVASQTTTTEKIDNNNQTNFLADTNILEDIEFHNVFGPIMIIGVLGATVLYVLNDRQVRFNLLDMENYKPIKRKFKKNKNKN